MAEDEFFKRIAEVDLEPEAPASERPVGTAARRGQSARASKSVEVALVESDDVGSQHEATEKPAVSEHPSVGRRGAASIRRAVVRIKLERVRITAVVAVGLGLGLAAAPVVVALHSVGGGSASTPHSEGADGLISQLAAVRADRRAISKALASERAARQLELRLARTRQAGRSKQRSGQASAAPVAAAAVPQARSAGTQESFGFERPLP